MTQDKPHIIVTGLRGFPDMQGGVETHAMNLFPEIATGGFRVTVILRSPYVKADHPSSWRGVSFLNVWAPRSKSLEAIVHTFIAVIYAAFLRPDILHIQAIGPALLTPVARLCGLKTVVTHHGPDYERQKWGAFARHVLQLGESLGMRFANGRIAISAAIQVLIRKKYGLGSALIPNGVVSHIPPLSSELVNGFDLVPGKYILMVSRLVPEKRHNDLIRAFAKTTLPGWKLVLAGAADHDDSYSQSIKELVKEVPNVIAVGFQGGATLQELYAHAGVFVLPSSHEGLPIVLLEALSYGIPVVVSDIEPHLEIALPQEHYFPMGNIDMLAQRIQQTALKEFSTEWREDTMRWVAERYNWRTAAQKTIALYRSVLEARSGQ